MKKSEVAALLEACFDGAQHQLSADVARWLESSRRFQTFVRDNQTKIRAKVRGARGSDRLDDLRAELEAAALLLREPRFDVAYETFAAAGGRGPDLTVTFKTHTPFAVEVRRLRGTGEDADGQAHARAMDVLCDKVGQLQPGMVNLLWLASDGAGVAGFAQAAALLRRRADDKDEIYFVRRGYRSAAAFLRQYARLSGIVVRAPGGLDLWLNPQVRHTVPPALVAALHRLDTPEA